MPTVDVTDPTSLNSSTADPAEPNTSRLLPFALEKSWGNYLAQLERCRNEFSEEAVHDLRVATRRLMAVIQLLRAIEPHPRLKRIIRNLKEQLDQFDELRDTQVILTDLSSMVEKLPDLQGFQNHQRLMEQELLQTLSEKVRQLDSTELAGRIRKTQDALGRQSEKNMQPEILQAVDDAYLRTRRRLDQVDLAAPATIHRVRVAFKRFRYMMEIAHSVLMDFPPTNLKWMNDYQTLMGNVQDAEVFLQRLGDYFTHGSVPDPDSLRGYYERREAKSISKFAAHMNQMNLFWRPAPDEPFPWERVE